MVTMSEVPVSAEETTHTTVTSSLGHRVVGAGGGLTGYAGGLRRKRILLDLEQDAAGRSARLF